MISGSVLSFRYWLEITPVEFSRPAGSRTPLMDADTFEMMVVGFQPISATLRMACAANLGVAATSSTSAPLFFSSRICVSMVGEVVS